MPGDDTPEDEPRAAQDQQEGADLPDGAAYEAHQHVRQAVCIHEALQVVLVEIGHGGGVGHRVHRAEEGGLGPGSHPGGHLTGPGEHEGPGGQGGVEEVLAHAAEELFDDDDGEEVAR